jgi:hypothetical protein
LREAPASNAILGGAVLLVTNAYFAGNAMPFLFFTLTLASVILVLLRVGDPGWTWGS